MQKKFEGGKMKAKIIYILVCTLLIAAAVLPAAGIMKIGQTTTTEPNDPQPTAIKTGYLSVPAAAFVAYTETKDYENWGSFIWGNGWFHAPIYLPNDATVTKLTFYWYDGSVPSDARLILVRYPMGGSEEDMAEVDSSGSSGAGFGEDNTIDLSIIDNIGYSYILALRLYDNPNLIYYNALIEYTYDAGGSSGEDIAENGQPQESQGYVIPLRER
jgi:hypothetical protein